MSYTPTEWKKGDLITSEKLNKIEEGIVNAGSSGGGVFIIEENWDEDGNIATLDKTLGEIKNAFSLKIPVFIMSSYYDSETDKTSFYNEVLIRLVFNPNNNYYELVTSDNDFYAVEDSDYPTNQQPSTTPSV